MRVKVWGARGSIPSPLSPEAIREKMIAVLQGATGIELTDPMAVRAYVDELDPVLSGTAGGNTPCIQIQADGKEIIVDAGSGIRNLGMELMNGPCGKGQGEIHLFLSHTHWDHIQGLPFFVPAFVPGNIIHIYSIHNVEPTLHDQMLPATFPVDFAYMRERSTLIFHPLRVGERFQLDEILVTNLRLPHPGEAFAYRFDFNGKTIVYASDAEYKKLDDNTTQPYVRFYAGADVLFFDSQFSLRESLLREDWGHSSSLIGADLARRASVRRLVLFHHDPTTTDQELLNIRAQTIAYQKTYDAAPLTEIYIGREGLAFNLEPVGKFRLDWLGEKETVILQISEQFDQQAVADVINQVSGLSREAAAPTEGVHFPRLIVDLTDVPQLSISGLRSLIDLRKLWEGNSIALAGLTAASRHVIELANFLDHFAIYPSVDIALASLEALDSLELRGQLLQERYRIDEKLGQSELSIVFKATDTRLDRPVILKVLSSNLGQTATQRLLQQTRHTARLRAPNIVTIYDWDEDWGLAYLVMEFVGNQTLRDALKFKRAIKPLEIAVDMLTAMEYAHSKGVIHGNLKPENVIIADDIKLTDFGFWWAEEGKRLTDIPMMLGNPDYLAPEQIMGQPVDARADLYSLGVILYEMFTGVKPFPGDPSDSMVRRLRENPVPPRQLNGEISVTLEHLILKLLSTSPQDRYETASQVKGILLGLESTVEAAPTGDAPDEKAERSKPRSRPLSGGHRRDAMIGRGEAVGQILEIWETARTGEGQVILLTGEAGVGKSFLVEHAVANMRDAVVLTGQGSEMEASQPYQLFVDVAAGYLEAFGAEQVVSHLGENASVLKSIVPGVTDFIPDLPELSPLDPDQERSRLIRSFASLIERSSKEQAMCIVLDNLQWADAATMQMLAYLTRQAASMPVLILGVYRELDLPPLHPLRELAGTLAEADYFHSIIVDRMDQVGVRDLLEDIWKQSVPEDWLRTIFERTGGNPFYVKEVAKALEDDGHVTFRNGQWEFKSLVEVALPRSVRDLIMRRFSRLDAGAQDFLRRAAVLGRQFTFLELVAVCGRSEAELLDILDSLLQRNLIREVEGGEYLAFTHADIHQTIYDELDLDLQKALHEQTGLALEIHYAENPEQYASRLAYHFVKAGMNTPAVSYGLMAARQAQSIHAFQNALYWYNQVVRILPEEHASLPDKISLYEGLGTIFQLQTNYADAREAFQCMEKAAMTLGDKAARGRALVGQAGVQDDLGDHRGALATVRQAIQAAQEAGDNSEVLKALAIQGWIYQNLGDYESARMVGERALAISKSLQIDHEIARHLNLLGVVYAALGDFKKSGHYLQEAFVLYRGLRDRNYQARVLSNLGENARRRGNHAEAIRYYLEALGIAREIDNMDAEVLFLSNLGGARVGNGDFADGEADLRKVLQIVEPSGWSHIAETFIFLGEACLGLGKIDDALAAGEKALAIGQEREQMEYVGRAWRLLGAIASITRMPITIGERPHSGTAINGRTGELRNSRYSSNKFRKYSPHECFAKSIMTFSEIHLQVERARTLREWAKYDLSQGETETAQRKWEEAMSLFAQLGMEEEAARMTLPAG